MRPTLRTILLGGGVLALLGVVVVFAFPGCTAAPTGGTGATGGAVKTLKGGGSTFVGPMMDEWKKLYYKDKGVTVEYTLGGSGMGISKMIGKEYDFGCTDAPMTDKEKKEAGGAAILHIPLVMGSLVPAYNLPVKEQLVFDGTLLSKIYLGQITKWNDPEIQARNPGVELPDLAITPVHRSDPSGSTYIWTDYLSKVNPDWAKKIGTGKEVPWPGVGSGAEKTSGMTKFIATTPGAIGYIEVRYALKDNIKFGLVRNKKGQAVSGDKVSAVTAAAKAAAKDIPDDLTFMFTNADGDESYPIGGAVWAVVYQQHDNPDKAKAIAAFLRWVAHDGQKEAEKQHYAPLPPELVERIDKKLDLIK